MSAYWGVLIAQSLRDPVLVHQFETVATARPGRSWTFHLVSVPAEQLSEQVHRLQAAMVTDDEWYAHFFRADELIIVFRDAVFAVGVDPATWEPAVTYGLAHAIPLEQLDFKPRTVEAARAFFGLDA